VKVRGDGVEDWLEGVDKACLGRFIGRDVWGECVCVKDARVFAAGDLVVEQLGSQGVRLARLFAP
jgi:hypothetical protein